MITHYEIDMFILMQEINKQIMYVNQNNYITVI